LLYYNDYPVYSDHSGTGFVQPTGTDADQLRAFTVNSFINGACSGTGAQECVRMRVFELCYNASVGTSFYPTVSAAWEAKTGATPSDYMPPQCTACLSQGWGTTEATPGFYVQCGCQSTCVDVSGNSQKVFTSVGVDGESNYPELASSYKVPDGDDATEVGIAKGTAMYTCHDYIKTNIVTTCTQMNIYHFVLWISLIAGLTLVFTAYSMMYMQLDMDSLLYTVGSSSKKND
jgi:hypothetical protein